jgi:O-acetyl-ADP-ribose deacetylase (regulator of RNase III)
VSGGGTAPEAELVAREELPGGRVFEAVKGDLLKQPVEAIVNAANSHLAHGGGVAFAIARAAGPDLQSESDALVRAKGPVPVGDAAVTGAGRLPFRAVIHAVGPQQGEGDEEEKLARAIASALARADERGFTSLAFPAVSSGIFGVPLDACARAYVRAVRGHFAARGDSPLRTVRLCLVDGPLVALVRAQVGR